MKALLFSSKDRNQHVSNTRTDKICKDISVRFPNYRSDVKIKYRASALETSLSALPWELPSNLTLHWSSALRSSKPQSSALLSSVNVTDSSLVNLWAKMTTSASMNLRSAIWHQFSQKLSTFSPAVCPPEKLTWSHSGLSWPTIWKRLKRKHSLSQLQRVSLKMVATVEDDQAPKIFTCVKTMLKWLNQMSEVQQMRAKFPSPQNFTGHPQIELLENDWKQERLAVSHRRSIHTKPSEASSDACHKFNKKHLGLRHFTDLKSARFAQHPQI